MSNQGMLKMVYLGFNQISIAVLAIFLIIIIISSFIDSRKKRPLTEKPKISFLISCYNSGKSIESSINSVFSSYNKNKFELIVIDDCSTDNSLEILKKLQKKYPFKILINKKNVGKAQSINNASKTAKFDLLWIVDSDVVLNKKAVEAMLARFENDKDVAAVNCAYEVTAKGLWARMHQMECTMMSLILSAHNSTSSLHLWGGCLAVKKDAFAKVGGFSKHMLTEDLDLAFKLNEQKMRVQHSLQQVKISGIESLKSWGKQKSRWISGTTQCYFNHVKVWTKHPFHVFFLMFFAIFSILFIVLLIKEIIFFNRIFESYLFLRETLNRLLSLKAVGVYYGLVFIRDFFSKLYFAVFSLPYTFQLIKRPREIYKVLYVFPFVLIYFPALSIIGIFSVARGIFVHYTIKKGERAW